MNTATMQVKCPWCDKVTDVTVELTGVLSEVPTIGFHAYSAKGVRLSVRRRKLTVAVTSTAAAHECGEPFEDEDF